ncbi:hypothetical protein NDU88_000961 [Pleurodeles waltl]|uniref:Uncharacterized protein n=1 Tax=Pleurodeles waltl TaxID=8319 RepID=A0AAV7URH5_PLEWA|nr:hypothetical protein NDU88_000961 [Pleurodeles waltl]
MKARSHRSATGGNSGAQRWGGAETARQRAPACIRRGPEKRSVEEMCWKEKMAHGGRTASECTRRQQLRPEMVRSWGPAARMSLENVVRAGAGAAAEQRRERALRGPVECTASAAQGPVGGRSPLPAPPTHCIDCATEPSALRDPVGP